MKKIFLAIIITIGLVGCNKESSMPNSAVAQKGIVGHWYFDLKASQSHATTKEEKYLLKSLVGDEMVIDNSGNFSSQGKKVGRVKEQSTNNYIVTTSSGKRLTATYKKPYLVVKERANIGEFTIYFTKKNVTKNAKSISKYIYLNQIYRQPKKVYDNGYLLYLFLDNGVVYSHVTNTQKISRDEILQKGTKLRYKYSNNKIYIRSAMFTVTIEAKSKREIHTSQGDRLILQ